MNSHLVHHPAGHDPAAQSLNGPPNVLNRLHALFTSGANAEAGPSRSRRLSEDQGMEKIHRAITSPDMPTPPPVVVKDRNALVVKLVTWNMGDALPKGDLSVLLGDAPEYQPLEVDDGLPIVPITDSHPYHIIVVAGQECPTESGAPRGIGGGLMKGMKLHHLHHKKGKEKQKEEENKLKAKEEEDESSDSTQDGRRTYESEDGEDGAESKEGSAEGSRANTPTLGSTPTLHRQIHTPASQKGWSNMLDDWLCGTLPHSREMSKSHSAEPSVITHPSPTHLSVDPPSMLRSTSAPVIISTSPQALPSLSHLKSPLARSPSSFTSATSLSDSDSSASEMEASFQMPLPTPAVEIISELRRGQRPEIIIPTDEPPRGMEGSKCYLHLTKQRLMGMYLSVYIHKDCRQLVSGVDKDFVTAGLAGGRLGNKGGIGISMKIADHRLLFVNSHLAAHTGRNSARMANIAKIKSELNLDCFLPKDDPRATAKDLTDRFDSVFWCGDLNFRLDVARLHAEWLVEQKKYEEALTWDQLRNSMMDPSTNPFTGFEEGPINFPPTFKYDVWKSVKTTNKNLRRSLRRRNSISKPRAAENGSTTPKVLDHVPEAEAEDLDDVCSRASDDGCRSPDLSRQSIESTRSFSASAARDQERELGTSYRDQAEINGYLNSHRPLDVKLREKTKKLVQLVKIKTLLSPSPSSSSRRHSRANSVNQRPAMDFDQASRRTSMSSVRSTRDRETDKENSPIVSSGPSQPIGIYDNSLLSPIEAKGPQGEMYGLKRRPSVGSAFGSPQRPGRAFSLKRTLSGKSMGPDLGDEAEKMDMRMDRREGVYDSSKKQRVPSWCDRVLWKCHPIPDIPESPSDQLSGETSPYTDKPRFGRLTMALSNIGLHLKSPITRTMSIEPSPSTRSMTPPLLVQPSHVVASPIHSSHSSHSAQSASHTPGTVTPTGLVPQPRSSLPGDPPLHPRNRAMSTDASVLNPSSPKSPVRHPLLQTGGSQSGSPVRPRVTIDSAASPSHDHVPRPRSNSDTVTVNPFRRQSTDHSPLAARPSIVPMRRLTGEPAPAIHTEQPVPDEVTVGRVRTGSGSGSGLVSSGMRNWGRTSTIHLDQGRDGEREDHKERNPFKRFIHEIPHWLHRHHASTAESEPEPEPAVVVEEEAPKRHLQGEVVCLQYGTIDDAGMRQLEGRSDHRPAIFAAAIYI